MKIPPKSEMTRLRFAAYIAMLVVTIVLLINLEFVKVVPSILLVAALFIIKAAAAPFIFGFILQSMFSRKNISNTVSLLIAVISMVSFWYFFGFQFLEKRSNLFIELFLLLGSIIVVKGFVDSGAKFFRKIQDKNIYNKSLKRDAAKDGRAPLNHRERLVHDNTCPKKNF